MTASPHDLSLVLPIKNTAWAKSRIDVPGATRQQVAMALARHSLEVATQCLPAEQIFVVTSDRTVRELADELGVRVVADPDRGLNQAIECGMKEARRQRPRSGVLVLVSDLPEIETETLSTFLPLLDPAAKIGQFVADHSGVGTSAVFCPPGVKVRMVFGPDSAARFEALGCRRVHNAPLELRTDLDTLDDLKALQSESRLSWLHSAAGLATI